MGLFDKDEQPLSEPVDYGKFLDQLAAGQVPPPVQVAAATPAPAAPAPVRAPAVTPAAVPVSTTPDQSADVPSGDISAAVRDAISKKFGLSPQADENALVAAQELGQQNRNTANFGAALGTLTSAISRSNKPADNSFYQQMGAQSDDQVKNVIQRRQAELQDQTLKKQQELEDPSSQQSQAFQSAIKKLYPNVFSDEQLSKLSAQDKDLVFEPLKLKEQIDSRKEIAAQNNEIRKGKAEDKKNSDLDKAYSELRGKLESFRGNQGAQQASKDLLSADKALQIVKGKDPNKLTTQDLNLLADELGKIATGGIPTEHGTQALLPNNLQTKFAELKNFITSKPTDAQAGEYIRKNLGYLNDMRAVAQQSLNSFRGNIAKGYKNRVKAEDYQEALKDYGLGDQQQQQQQQQSASDGRVKIISPNGKRGTVPASQLQDALTQGYLQDNG